MILLALTVLPAAMAIALLLAGRRADALAPAVAVTVALIELGLAIAAALTRPTFEVAAVNGISAALRVDGLAAIAVITVAVVFLAVIVFAVGDIGPSEARARFFGTMLLFVAAMFVTVTAVNVFTLLAAWEIMGATSYALIGFWWPDADRVRSGGIAFITTRSADVGMYVAAGAALAGGAAGLNLAQLGSMSGGWRDVALAGLALAALGKSAQLPFSFWLSHAMAGPSPVSALLHSATMVAAGGYLLLRIEPGITATGWLGPVVAWIGASTALLLGAVAVAQRDLKQLLAASTCSQIGFIVLAAGVGGVAGGAAQFVAHAAVKSLLFLVAGAWLAVMGTKDLLQLRGAARTHPVAGATFTIGALALGGLPPLSIWVAKDQILGATLPDSAALYIVGLAAAALSAAYAAKALAVVWTQPRSDDPLAAIRARRMPVSEVLPLPALATAAVVLALLGIPSVSAAWARLLGLPDPVAPAPWELVVSAAVAVAVIVVVAWWQRVRLARADELVAEAAGLRGWLGLEAGVNVVIVRPITALSGWCARFDDRILVRVVDAVGAGAVRVSHIVDSRLERGFGGAVGAVAGAVRKLAASAVRPQTGLIHQYYAQAIIVMVVLSAVLVLVR